MGEDIKRLRGVLYKALKEKMKMVYLSEFGHTSICEAGYKDKK